MKKRDEMYKRIHKHGITLQMIFHLRDKDPVELCKQLRRLEAKIHSASEDYCNGVIGDTSWERQKAETLDKLDRLLQFRSSRIPVFINGDPRGYALKIEDSYVREHNLTIERDWGGYGLIAPDLTER